MIKRASAFIFVLLLAWVGLFSTDRALALAIGDKAPKLQPGKWLQGEPVTQFETNKAYIVEFWATWCGPCKTSIPHLNEIYKKFKDKGLVVIGQNVMEHQEGRVEPFLKEMGESMTYRVATDKTSGSGSGSMVETWMEPLGLDGVPYACLIGKDGRIAMVDHPMALTDAIIESLLAGTINIQKSAADFKKRTQGRAVMAQLIPQLNALLSAQDWTKAEEVLAVLEKEAPEGALGNIDMVKFQILLKRNKPDEAAKAAQAMVATRGQDPNLIVHLCFNLLSNGAKEGAAIKIVSELATIANTVTQGQQPGCLDILARAQFLLGNTAKAIELSQRSVEIAPSEPLKAILQKSLDSFKAGKSPAFE